MRGRDEGFPILRGGIRRVGGSPKGEGPGFNFADLEGHAMLVFRRRCDCVGYV